MAQSLDFGKIKDSCSNLTNLAGSIDGTIDSIDSSVTKINSPAWVGKASAAFRDKITTLVENLPEANRQLAESIFFLASCADAYDQLSNDAVKKLKDLIGGQSYIDKYDVNAAPDVDLTSRYGVEQPASPTTTLSTSEETSQSYSSGGVSSGGTRYSYSVGPGTAGAAAVVATPVIESAPETTSSLTDLVATDLKGKTIEIPSSIKQGSYTVTGYDYWINSGKQMTWVSGTNQNKVAEIWRQQGSVFKNGIAVINVDGEDRYLVAVSPKFGQSGDCIDVTLEDGTVIKCIIGDSKGSDAGSEWGHVLGDGSINVLEFEVQREKYLQSGNPTTEKWNLPWDSSKDVKSITNQGSIIGAKVTEKTVVTDSAKTESLTKAFDNLTNEYKDVKEVKFTDLVESKDGSKWINEAISTNLKDSGYEIKEVIPETLSVKESLEWFKKNNNFQEKTYTPKVGDVIYAGEGTTPTHIGLITSIKDNVIEVLDGSSKENIVKIKLNVGDPLIQGYGIPNYSELLEDSE